jgi:nucleoside-diphosphate-sugar epimerase
VKILVTGAGGFAGRALCRHLARMGHEPVAAVRGNTADVPPDSVLVPDIGPDTDWRAALHGIDTVVHLAARVHVDAESAADPLAEYRRVNVAGTRRLAQAALDAGVRRIVLLSSVKVHGDCAARPLTETDAPDPQDAYAISKLEAERALVEIADTGQLEWVILRPPLVYGPGVKANFLRLLQAVARGAPLPLAAIHNRRSLLFVENLVDAIAACSTHAAASGRVFLVSDGEEVSTPDLVRRLADALHVKARLFAVPPELLMLAGALVGRREAMQRLTGSLVVNAAAIREQIGWVPPFDLDAGLQATARWFLERASALDGG